MNAYFLLAVYPFLNQTIYIHNITIFILNLTNDQKLTQAPQDPPANANAVILGSQKSGPTMIDVTLNAPLPEVIPACF
jgi:hypothetical protein